MEVFLTLLAIVLIVLMAMFCFFQVVINTLLKGIMDFFGIKDVEHE